MTTGEAVLMYAIAGAAFLMIFAVGPVVNAIENYVLSFLHRDKSEHSVMRRLKMPFLAGSASLIIIGALAGQHLFPRWESENQLIGGLIIGVLASVVLYAMMRAIAERNP
jgi:hypothetical protein